MLNVAEIGERLGLSKSSVYDLLASGTLRHYCVGTGRGAKRCSEEQVAEYLASVERGGPAKSAEPPPKRPMRKLKFLSP